MSDFKAKMHRIRFPLGFRPVPAAGGAYSAPPDPLLYLRGLLLRGAGKGEGKGRERDGRVGVRGREEWVGPQSASGASSTYHAVVLLTNSSGTTTPHLLISVDGPSHVDTRSDAAVIADSASTTSSPKPSAECTTERILKIAQYLAKI